MNFIGQKLLQNLFTPQLLLIYLITKIFLWVHIIVVFIFLDEDMETNKASLKQKQHFLGNK